MFVPRQRRRLAKAAMLALAIAAAPIAAHAQAAVSPALPASTTALQPASVNPTSATPGATTAAPARPPVSPQAVGGLNCLMFGSAAAVGVYVYNDVLMVAISGYVNPTLLIPAMAGAFVAGCSIGNTLTPGLMYLQSLIF